MHLLIVDDELADVSDPTIWLQRRADKFGWQLDVDVASSCEEALALASREQFDLILLDFHLDRNSGDPNALTGLTAIRAIKAAFPGSPVAIRSGERDRRIIMDTIHAGAAGYIPKSFKEEETVSAVECVLQTGGVYLPTEALDGANPYPARIPPPDEERRQAFLDALTPQQMKILHYTTQGLANKEIAAKVFLSEQTVKAHLSDVYRRMGVHNRVEAVVEAVRLQLFLNYTPDGS